MATFTVQVVSAERELLSVEAEGLYIRTTIGSMGILPGHQPLLAGLDIGEAHIDLTDGSREYVAVHRGYVYYSGGDTAVILADVAELHHEIDVEHQRSRLVELEELHAAEKHDEVDFDLPAVMRMTKARIETVEKAS